MHKTKSDQSTFVAAEEDELVKYGLFLIFIAFSFIQMQTLALLDWVSLFENNSEICLYSRLNTTSTSSLVFKYSSLHIHNRLLQFVLADFIKHAQILIS